MKKWEMNRRAFLKAGSATFALPFLEAMLPSYANAAGAVVDPKRYICFYIASGTYLVKNDGAFWYPTTTGPLNPTNLPTVFQPFASNAAHYSIVRGLENAARYQCVGGGDHSTSVATYLSCTPYTDSTNPNCTMAGTSIDQMLATSLGLKAYAMSAGGYDGYIPDQTAFDYGRTVSYNNGKQVETWLNPYKLFTTLFASVPPAGAPLPAVARNKSVLDNAYAAITKLKSQLGTADRQRVEDYFSGLREVEIAAQRLATAPVCTITASPSTALNNEDHRGDGTDFADRLKAFCDIMILAFKCNNAQVFTMMFEYENTNRRFRNLIPSNLVYGGANMDTPGSHNEVAHWGDGGTDQITERTNRCISRDRFYMSYVNYMIDALKNVTDPTGASILDNTIIQMGHGLRDGNHGTDGISSTVGFPLVLAGGKSMLRPGNFHSFTGTDLKDLYYTIATKMGANIGNFRGSTKLINV